MGSSKAIGGYFGLELPNGVSVYHDKALALNLGRSGLELIISTGFFTRLWVPSYTCDVVVNTIKRMGIDYRFYRLDAHLLPSIDDYMDGDAVLYTNYFGVYANGVREVRRQYENVVIDNCQAFFDAPLPHTPTFYSPRKFFGVPDGGFLYAQVEVPEDLELDQSHERCGHLLRRIDLSPEFGFAEYRRNDKRLEDESLKKMSRLTHAMLSGVDYELAKKDRNQNFLILDRYLGSFNELPYSRKEIVAPLCYPFLHSKGAALKKYLIQHRVFVPTYWPGAEDLVDTNSIEQRLIKDLACLPIDQRYDDEDMDRIIHLMQNFGIG